MSHWISVVISHPVLHFVFCTAIIFLCPQIFLFLQPVLLDFFLLASLAVFVLLLCYAYVLIQCLDLCVPIPCSTLRAALLSSPCTYSPHPAPPEDSRASTR